MTAAILALLAVPRSAGASPEAIGAALDRLAVRETFVAEQMDAAEGAARARARQLCRLSRGGGLAFMVDPRRRLDRARVVDLGRAALRRDLTERRLLAAELSRLRAERDALVDALSDPARAGPAPTAGIDASAPVSGPLVGAFGPAHEPLTGIQLRRTEIQLLSRGAEPVRAVAPGVVRRLERASGGAWAVVVAHAGRWTSVVSGMREVRVAVGEPVAARQVLGLAGRTFDGAPIVTLGLWRGRVAVDPAPLLGLRRRRAD